MKEDNKKLLHEHGQLSDQVSLCGADNFHLKALNAELLEASKKVVKALKDSIRVNGQVCMTAGIAFSIDEDLQKAIAKAEGKH